MSSRPCTSYSSWISQNNWSRFVFLAGSQDISKGTVRSSLRNFLFDSLLTASTKNGDFCLHYKTRIDFFYRITAFFSYNFVIDYPNSKGNRTEQLTIEFNKELKVFFDSIQSIIKSLDSEI